MSIIFDITLCNEMELTNRRTTHDDVDDIGSKNRKTKDEKEKVRHTWYNVFLWDNLITERSGVGHVVKGSHEDSRKTRIKTTAIGQIAIYIL